MISPREEKQELKKILFGSISKKLLFWFLIISILPLMVVGFIAIDSFTGNTYSDTIYEGNVELTLQSRTIESFLSGAESDILFLSQTDGIEKMINSKDQNEYLLYAKEVEKDFLAFATNKPIYYKLRYIDEYGNEIVFIENNKKKPRIIYSTI